MSRARRFRPTSATRRGSIIALSAVLIVMILAFTSFTVDFGWIALTRAQMRNASDAAVLAGASELAPGTGLDPMATPAEIRSSASDAARTIADANPSGDLDSTYIDVARDVRFGQLQWNEGSQSWNEVWGAQPYTLVEVTVHRDRGSARDVNGSSVDGPLPLFFGPVIGHENAGMQLSSAAAIMPGVGFRIASSSSALADVLPIALDAGTWDARLEGIGGDEFSYDDDLDEVVRSPDGVLEVSLYPSGQSNLPPGNRGTVDIGSPSNSTADLKRQIRHGISADDLAWFGGELRFDEDLQLNGDTGLSAGIESALKDIIGEARAIPLFSSVSGPGNNATYVIDRFVGIRVMEVRIKGNPNRRRVVVQPAPFADPSVVRGETEVREDSIFTTPVLVR